MIERTDYEAAERAEAELDRFISKRDREREEANRTEGLWRASERRVREKRRQANRQAWIDHHGKMYRLHLGLADEHTEKRSRLMLELDHAEERGEPEYGLNEVPRKDARVSGARGILPGVRKVGPARPGELRAGATDPATVPTPEAAPTVEVSTARAGLSRARGGGGLT